MKFATKAIHAGINPDPSTGAIMTPIFQTSTYVQESPGKHKGYEYARTQNPTRDVLERNIAALENGKYGLCFDPSARSTSANSSGSVSLSAASSPAASASIEFLYVT